MIGQLPKKVYKFMDAKWLKVLKFSQQIYIKPLSGYDENIYGTERGDNGEGHLNINGVIENYTFGVGENESLDKFVENTGAIKVAGGGSVSVGKAIINNQVIDNNYLNYSVCLEDDIKVRNEFGGSCLVIEDFPAFVYYLNQELFKKGKELHVAQNCLYLDERKNSYDKYENEFMFDIPGLVKEKKHEYQKEFRLLWRNKDGSNINEPEKVYSPKALKYCKFEFEDI